MGWVAHVNPDGRLYFCRDTEWPYFFTEDNLYRPLYQKRVTLFVELMLARLEEHRHQLDNFVDIHILVDVWGSVDLDTDVTFYYHLVDDRPGARGVFWLDEHLFEQDVGVTAHSLSDLSEFNSTLTLLRNVTLF